MFSVRVYVSYKESVLDPQAEVIEGAINRLGYGHVVNVKIGKVYDFRVEASNKEEAIKIADEVSNHLLANVNMESYDIQLVGEE